MHIISLVSDPIPYWHGLKNQYCDLYERIEIYMAETGQKTSFNTSPPSILSDPCKANVDPMSTVQPPLNQSSITHSNQILLK